MGFQQTSLFICTNKFLAAAFQREFFSFFFFFQTGNPKGIYIERWVNMNQKWTPIVLVNYQAVNSLQKKLNLDVTIKYELVNLMRPSS